jgi:ankyrin repeat protein
MKVRAASRDVQEILQAATDGRLTDLQRLLEKQEQKTGGTFDVKLARLACNSGCMALHWAAGAGQEHMVDYLLQRQENGKPRFFHVDTPAVGKSLGRRALHYACRNGHVHVVRRLVEVYGADPNAKARHNVTPLQLAVWQGRLVVARYLVEHAHVNPHQTNDFDCGLVHWMGLAPTHGAAVDIAKWLHEDLGLPMTHVVQRQGHSALHKAAWGGNLALCRYLHERVGMWDDRCDVAGNYAVDLARMAQHGKSLVDYLQRVASRTTFQACQILQVSFNVHERTASQIQKAYRGAIRGCHPDGKEQRRKRMENSALSSLEFESKEEGIVSKFQLLTEAYRHLLAIATGNEDDEELMENHALHELPRLLTYDGSTPLIREKGNDDNCFQARLFQVVDQNSGLDLSNLRKKWKQLWPGIDFPERSDQISLQEWLRQEVSSTIMIQADDRGVLRLYPRKKDTTASRM